MLVPAGVLVLMVLGAIAVDSAVAFLGQRQLADAVSSAANDAATAAVVDRAFYGRGSIQLDPQRAGQVACETVRAQADGRLENLAVQVGVTGRSVTVRASASVEEVFGHALPGSHWRTVSATATARAEAHAGDSGSQATLFQSFSC
jgi:hypothetical protein